MINLRFAWCLLLCAGLAVGCGSAASPTATARPSTVPTAVASPGVSPTDVATPPSSVEPAEAARLAARVLGSGNVPGYSVEAPSGWSAGDGRFVVKSSGGVIGLSVWDVDQVPRDPCHWKGQMIDPGPTVDDFVRAIVAQPLRNASKPTDVTLAGYPGQYLEWSVPVEMVVTGDGDFEGCDVEPSNGHLDFISWLSTSGGSRFHQVAGQVDRLWALDVDGQRLVVDATYSPGTSQVDRAELGRVAESLRFDDR